MQTSRIIKKGIGFFFVSLLITTGIQAQLLTAKVKVTNIPQKQGYLLIGWYNKAYGFKEVNNALYKQVIQLNGEDSFTATFAGISPGDYSIALFLMKTQTED